MKNENLLHLALSHNNFLIAIHIVLAIGHLQGHGISTGEFKGMGGALTGALNPVAILPMITGNGP